MRIVCLWLLLFTTTVKAQTDSTFYDIVKDSIITKFNRGDFKGIYAMADTGFKAAFREEQIVGILNSAGTLGKILSSELISEEKEQRSYRLIFAKKSLQLSLGVVSPVSYVSFGLSFYKLPIVRTRQHFLADNPLKTQLDSVVQKAVTVYMSNKNVAGLSVGIVRNGQLYMYNYGEMKKGEGRLPGVNTIFEIGSVTKTFTGILLANAVLEGKVKLDDDIRKYLDGNYPNLQYNGQPVQLVHLSNHTSGFPSMPKLNNGEDPFSPSVQVTPAMMAEILHRVTLDTVPGTRRSYSNFAVGLLGHILEKVYKTNYEQLVKKYILDLYHMQHTKISLSPDDYKDFATGYDMEGRSTAYWINRLATPAGGIRSTTHDMLLYIRQQLDPRNKAAQLSHQLTFGDTTRGTGLNWGIATTSSGKHRQWSHDGGTDGFTSLCIIYPELKAGIMLLTNTGDHFDDSFNEIARAVYRSWLR
ncbi:serine hydrolase [Paraflavitalea soli]|uniref:Serine hydrolase n=1 Tax=Paraflavitalea soli TaxID=2315862 RepID=A0A3B7MVS4_9BACT|nr:serine hydrolase [Paraflavitalea soli]AXY78198.1 serine hydrolase [Paraflavitalea soli]